jgi:hypothetical protein
VTGDNEECLYSGRTHTWRPFDSAFDSGLLNQEDSPYYAHIRLKAFAVTFTISRIDITYRVPIQKNAPTQGYLYPCTLKGRQIKIDFLL